MKIIHDKVFLCDSCMKNITDKKHVRITLGFDSGWMIPPFLRRFPDKPISLRKPVFHFCKVDCLSVFFAMKLDEKDQRQHEGGAHEGSDVTTVRSSVTA